ncbi:cytochrome P450, partial [Suillus plorans]
GTMFGAGSETVSSYIASCLKLCSQSHTDAQARVQEELDHVVGRTRLPTFADQEMLPQVTMFILESLSGRPPFTTGFAHRVTKDI